MFRLQLLKNLCTETPNAYVLIGEKYYPTRSELFEFEMFRLARKTNMFKFHEGLPIILTLEEDQLPIYEQFEKYLIFGTPIDFLKNGTNFILFLKSICCDKEIENILRTCKPNSYSQTKLFTVDTWKELMEYNLEPLFMDDLDRRDICIAVHRGTYEFKKYEHNEYAFRLLDITAQNLEEKEPLLYKALRFYKISLQGIKDRYPYREYSSTSHGSC